MRVSTLGKVGIEANGISFIIPAILFSLVFTQIDYIHAQTSEAASPKTDTLRVLNSRLKVILKTSAFTVMKTDQLLNMYSTLFNVGQVLRTDGFSFGENSTLRFYLTNIENSTSNDGGLSTWKLIESFTDKIPQGEWIESGWEQLSNGLLYFVKMVSHEKPHQFYKFVFFYVDDKLAFSLFQCPIYPLEAYPSEPEKYVSIVSSDPHPSRFTGFQKK